MAAVKGRSVGGSKAGSSTPKQPTIASDSTPSIATAKMLFAYSWGEIVGPGNGLQSVKLGGTPIQAADGTVNFPGAKWQFRSGAMNQDRLVGFPEINNEISIGVELRSTTPWVRSVTASQIDAVRVRLSWPQLQSQDSGGNVNGYRIDYAIDVATDGGAYVPLLTTFVDRKNTTKYERSHRVELPAGSSWVARVRRLTPNQTSSLIADTMFVEAFTEVIDAEQTYPLTAVGGIEFDAQQFPSIPKVSVLMRGRILKVPSNYDAESRTYSGVWDGTFKLAYTNNPAWVWYDLVLNPYYGLGKRINASMVNRYALYRIAQWCDQLVPNGKGGLEPRFTCNLYLQSQEEAYHVLQDIASIFHGMSYWDGSQMVATADMPEDPAYSFHRGNIIKGSLKYQGIRKRDRHSRAVVSWDNPANAFETEPEPVFDEESIALFGIQDLSIGAVGCTSLGQAQRAGNFALITEKTQKRPASFRVGLDGQIPRPGQVIRLSDEMLAGRANGGRISAALGRKITLDRDTVVPIGSRLVCNLPTGVSEARIVTAVTGRVVTVAAIYSVLPVAECGWVIDSDDLATMQFKVQSISRPEWKQFQFELIQHEPGKYDAVDNGTKIDPPPISIVPPGVQPPPTNVHLLQNVAVHQGLSVTTMTIAWDAPAHAVGYDVEWRKNSGDWVRVPRTGDLGVDVVGVYSGQYLARVRAVNAMDVASIPANSVLTDITGKVGLPPSVTHLTATALLFGIGLKWGFPAGAEDTQRTEIWYGPSTSLEAATKLADLAYPQSDYSMQSLQAGARFFFWARLVDRTGNIGPFYPVGNGVMGQASADAGPILDQIAGKIGETELGQNLLKRIDLIDGAPSVPGSVNARIAVVAGTIGDVSAAVTQETTNRVNGDAALGQRIDTVSATASAAAAAVQTESTARASGDTALGSRIDSVTAVANGAAAAVGAESTARVNADNALGSRIDTVTATTGQNTALIQAEATARTNADSALATRVDGVYAQVNPALAGDTAGLAGNDQAFVGVWSEQSARIEDGVATGQRIDTVQVQVGQTSATVQTVSKAVADLDGKASASWSVKLQVNQQGQYVAAGIGLGIENGPAGLQSTFLVSADTFAVVNGINGSLSSPFAVTGGQVFIRSAFIQDGSITMLKIGDALQSDNYVAGMTGWRLTKAGVFEINGNVAGSGRMTMTNSALKVFDNNGVKRVQLGDLNA